VSGEPLLSVVVPCFNEARTLARLSARFAEAGAGTEFALILVDNGSTDGTDSELRRLSSDPGFGFVRALRLPRNLGYGGGLQAGLGAARGEFLAWTHADLQCDPTDVFTAFRCLQKCGDPARTLVKGRRGRRGLLAEITTRGMQTLATGILGRSFRDINGQPKVFHRSLMTALADPPCDFSYDLYVLLRAMERGWRISTVPVSVAPRAHGRSTWASSPASWLAHVSASVRTMIRLRLMRRA
jgi:glycosyltransferase involved in cell wall biosynthesis